MGRSPCWPLQGSKEGWRGGQSWHRNGGFSLRSPKPSTSVTKVPRCLPVPAWDLANWLPGQWSVGTGKSSDTLCVFQTSVHKYPYLYSGICVCLGELIKGKRVRSTLLPFSSSLMVSLNVDYHLLLLGPCEGLPSPVWALCAFRMIPGYVANPLCLHCLLWPSWASECTSGSFPLVLGPPDSQRLFCCLLLSQPLNALRLHEQSRWSISFLWSGEGWGLCVREKVRLCFTLRSPVSHLQWSLWRCHSLVSISITHLGDPQDWSYIKYTNLAIIFPLIKCPVSARSLLKGNLHLPGSTFLLRLL